MCREGPAATEVCVCVSECLSLHVYLLVSHVAQSHVKYAHGEIGTGNETMYVCMYVFVSVSVWFDVIASVCVGPSSSPSPPPFPSIGLEMRYK